MSGPSEAPLPMEPDRWQHIHEVLADAIDCPVAQRDALLDARCAGDPSLRREVESLLVAHEGVGLVDQLGALVKPAAAWLPPPATEWSGRRTALPRNPERPEREREE